MADVQNENNNGVDWEPHEPLSHADLLEEIVRALVADQDSVKITEHMDEPGGNVLYLNIDVAPDERGKIVGKGADTIKLIQRLFIKIGAADNRLVIRVNLTKGDGPGPQSSQQRKHRLREKSEG